MPRTANPIATIIENPSLQKALQELPASHVCTLFEDVEVEDIVEFIPLLKTSQLEAVLDRQLWQLSPEANDEKLDTDNFLKWVEALMEYSPDFASRQITELDDDFVVHALLQFLCIVDRSQTRLGQLKKLRRTEQENTLIEKALEASETYEFSRFIIYSFDETSWYVLHPLIDHIAKKYPEYFESICQCVSAVAADWVEDSGGLHHVASQFQHINLEMEGQRRERRAEAGFVEPTMATHFLSQSYKSERDYRAQFNEYLNDFLKAQATLKSAPPTAALNELIERIEAYTKRRPSPVAQLTSDRKQELPLKFHIWKVKQTDQETFQSIQMELQFLANCVIEALSEEKRLNSWEAMDFVFATCQLGGCKQNEIGPYDLLDGFVRGWKVLKEKFQPSVARVLAEALEQFSGDSWAKKHARTLAVTLQMNLKKEGLDFFGRYDMEWGLFFDNAKCAHITHALGKMPRFAKTAQEKEMRFFGSESQIIEFLDLLSRN